MNEFTKFSILDKKKRNSIELKNGQMIAQKIVSNEECSNQMPFMIEVREKGGHTDGQTGRQTNIQTDRQTFRQTGREMSDDVCVC